MVPQVVNRAEAVEDAVVVPVVVIGPWAAHRLYRWIRSRATANEARMALT